MSDEIAVVPRTSERAGCLLGVLFFVLGAAAIRVDGDPHHGMLVLLFVVLLLSGVLVLHARLLSRIRIGPDRVTGLRSLRHGAFAIELTRAVVEAPHGGQVIVVRDGERVWKLKQAHAKNWREIVEALRARVRPSCWLPSAPAGRERRRASQPRETTSSYREASSTVHALPAWATSELRARARVLALATIAIVVGLGFVVSMRSVHAARRAHVATVERRLSDGERTSWLGGMLLVGVGLVGLRVGATPLGLLGAARMLRWVGRSATCDGPRSVRAGARRVRATSTRPATRVGANVSCWELLDEHDRTSESHAFSNLWTDEPEARALTRELAVMTRAKDSGRHFVGPSDPKSGAAPISRGAARVLVLDVHADGVALHRFSESRGHVGDTWHPTREHALSQIADEYGERDLAFVDVPLDPNEGPIAFFAHVDLDRSRVVRV